MVQPKNGKSISLHVGFAVYCVRFLRDDFHGLVVLTETPIDLGPRF